MTLDDLELLKFEFSVFGDFADLRGNNCSTNEDGQIAYFNIAPCVDLPWISSLGAFIHAH